MCLTKAGEPIVVLPTKTVQKCYLDFSPGEREIYNYIFDRARRTFSANQAAGTVLKNYTTIFSMLLRLRQSCCHVSLVKQAPQLEDRGAEAENEDKLGDDVNLDQLLKRFSKDRNGKSDVRATYGEHVVKQIIDEAASECPICSTEPIEEQAVTMPCFHTACKKCILQYIEVMIMTVCVHYLQITVSIQ